MSNPLKDEFHKAMIGIYHRAKREAEYTAQQFIGMVEDIGGVACAKKLINAAKISDGFAALWERERLDLTVEAMILETEKYQMLFTEDELAICRKRLKDCNYRG